MNLSFAAALTSSQLTPKPSYVSAFPPTPQVAAYRAKVAAMLTRRVGEPHGGPCELIADGTRLVLRVRLG